MCSPSCDINSRMVNIKGRHMVDSEHMKGVGKKVRVPTSDIRGHLPI